jgi:hypothetical protein
MAEIPKLAPEVEIPRPRSSGIAVVAVAALAMFTAVGASAFVVRMRMSHRPCAAHFEKMRRQAAPPRAARLELRDVFIQAAARGDDETALEIYRGLPPGSDPTGELAQIHDLVIARQVALLERELASGDCDAMKARVAWLRRVAPEEQIGVRASECRRARIVEVELVNR